jgi:TPR repeat protein
MIGTNNHQKAEAVYYLGLMYEYGFGVDRSPKKAFNYYA